MPDFDVMVVGGGPAGLSAALYLGRFDRTVGLFDAGQGRSTWHQINHNYLGFPGGIAARELRKRGYEQVGEYPQVQVMRHKIEQLRRVEGVFYATSQAREYSSRAVILCTGVIDHYPHFDGWEEYVGRSMFWCITCDGYGCREACVVVLGNSNSTAAEALQLQRFTSNVTVLTNSDDCVIDQQFQRRLERANIPLLNDKVVAAEGADGQLKVIILKGGARVELDQLFSQQGATPKTELAKELGVLLSVDGYIHVDTEQRTNILGVFAAGDVTRLHSHQITTAVHEGGQAASAANYFLYPPELRDE
ncbi:MAG: thioredoxin-disulfide reductase [Herpetosiphon sp.]